MSSEDRITDSDVAELLAGAERYAAEVGTASLIVEEIRDLMCDAIRGWLEDRSRVHLDLLRDVEGEPLFVTQALALAPGAVRLSDRGGSAAMNNSTSEGLELVDVPAVAAADARVNEAYAVREAAVSRVRAAQDCVASTRKPHGPITDADRAARSGALDELGAATESRAAAEVELRDALRDRERTVRRSVAACVDTWRPAHREVVEEAQQSVRAALDALLRVEELERAAQCAADHPAVRVSMVPVLNPSARGAVGSLRTWLRDSSPQQ